MGVPELVIILLIVVLVFGAGKVPGAMSDLGKGMAAFKKGLRDAEDELKAAKEDVETDTLAAPKKRAAAKPKAAAKTTAKRTTAKKAPAKKAAARKKA